MKTYQPINPSEKPRKLLISDYRMRRASAFAQGTCGITQEFEFLFELEAYQLGVEQTQRLRSEIQLGLR